MKHLLRRQWLLLTIGTIFLTFRGTVWAAKAPLRITIVDLMSSSELGSGKAPAAGILTTAVRDLAQFSGLQILLVPLPYARGLALLAGGEIDLMLGVETEHLDSIAVRVAEVGQVDIAVIGRAGLRITSLADLSGKRVGHLRSSDYDSSFARSTDILKYQVNTYSQGLQMVRFGRLDAFIGIRQAIIYTTKNISLPAGSVGSMIDIRRAPVSLYISKDNTDVRTVEKLRGACELIRKKKVISAMTGELSASRVGHH